MLSHCPQNAYVKLWHDQASLCAGPRVSEAHLDMHVHPHLHNHPHPQPCRVLVDADPIYSAFADIMHLMYAGMSRYELCWFCEVIIPKYITWEKVCSPPLAACTAHTGAYIYVHMHIYIQIHIQVTPPRSMRESKFSRGRRAIEFPNSPPPRTPLVSPRAH